MNLYRKNYLETTISDKESYNILQYAIICNWFKTLLYLLFKENVAFDKADDGKLTNFDQMQLGINGLFSLLKTV